jgi:C4-dicarboxylate-specific signal transduction histidine kinase
MSFPRTSHCRACRAEIERLQAEKALRDSESRARQYVRRGEIRYRPVPADQLVDECRVLLDTEARHHQVNLELDVEEFLPTVWVDSVLIQQVILNLVKNGIDAINDSDHSVRELQITISTGSDNELLVEIRDSGSGVADELRERWFEPFESNRKDGMGIGLVLCQSIIDNHDGRLWLKSTGPDGSVFRFSLPALEPGVT